MHVRVCVCVLMCGVVVVRGGGLQGGGTGGGLTMVTGIRCLAGSRARMQAAPWLVVSKPAMPHRQRRTTRCMLAPVATPRRRRRCTPARRTCLRGAARLTAWTPPQAAACLPASTP